MIGTAVMGDGGQERLKIEKDGVRRQGFGRERTREM